MSALQDPIPSRLPVSLSQNAVNDKTPVGAVLFADSALLCETKKSNFLLPSPQKSSPQKLPPAAAPGAAATFASSINVAKTSETEIEHLALESFIREFFTSVEDWCTMPTTAAAASHHSLSPSSYPQEGVSHSFRQLCTSHSVRSGIASKLLLLDFSHTSQTHKVALFYKPESARSLDDMVGVSRTSWFFERFMSMLGTIVPISELLYTGGLNTHTYEDGQYVLVHQDATGIMIFHVPVLMPVPIGCVDGKKKPTNTVSTKSNTSRSSSSNSSSSAQTVSVQFRPPDVSDRQQEAWTSVRNDLRSSFMRSQSVDLSSLDSADKMFLLHRKRHTGNDFVHIFFCEVFSMENIMHNDNDSFLFLTPNSPCFGMVMIFVYYIIHSCDNGNTINKCEDDDNTQDNVWVDIKVRESAPDDIRFLESKTLISWGNCASYVRSIAAIADTFFCSQLGNKTDEDSPINWLRRMQIIRNIQKMYGVNNE